jgi:RimJ/RimL family protein N-acetyltransferase
MAASVARSALDEARFRVRTARAEDVDVEDLPSIVEFCRQERIQFLIARCPVGRIHAVQAMEDAGFLLMDTWLRYEGALTVDTAPPDGSGIRLMDRPDADGIESVARASFADYSGHYHADPRLDRGQADEAYVSWARRCCSGEAADAVYVVERDGRIVAFAAFRLSQPAVGELVLGAVSSQHRGQGLYQDLTRTGMSWARGRGANRFQAATHLSNIAAQRTWSRLGMSPVAAAYTLHKWFA